MFGFLLNLFLTFCNKKMYVLIAAVYANFWSPVSGCWYPFNHHKCWQSFNSLNPNFHQKGNFPENGPLALQSPFTAWSPIYIKNISPLIFPSRKISGPLAPRSLLQLVPQFPLKTLMFPSCKISGPLAW